jgi:hypothetical protein
MRRRRQVRRRGRVWTVVLVGFIERSPVTKNFFFEKKKQKTFAYPASASPR